MPIFGAVGAAILGAGASAGTAAAVGALAIGATAAGIGSSIYGSISQADAAKKAASTAGADAGRIQGEEAQNIVAKRLARTGLVFTSPLGDTSNLSTASQKVFS